MENILSYSEFSSKIPESGQSFLLLYREGSEQSVCALRNIGNAFSGSDKPVIFSADVNVVKDIHQVYGIDSVPSLLIFSGSRLINVIKGCQDSEYYNALAQNRLFRSAQPSSGKAVKNVTVYSTPSCSWCNTLKEWLKDKNIKFTDIDISRDQDAAEDLVRRSGQQGVPQTDINGQIIVGFDQPRLQKLLEIQ